MCGARIGTEGLRSFVLVKLRNGTDQLPVNGHDLSETSFASADMLSGEALVA